MPRELKNVNVTHVSFVDKAANKKKFFLTKSADKSDPVFETTVRTITKADDPQKLVYGVVYEPDVKDAHDDFMTADEIEKAAHGFMQNYQQIDKQHDFEAGAGTVVQSYIAPCDLDVGETIAKGSWVLVTKATDEIWESIQKGEFTGYSLAGTAEPIEKQTENGLINEFKSFMKSFFNTQKQEDEEMKIEDITKAFTDALQPVNERLENLEKASTDGTKEKTPEELAAEKKKKEEADASDAVTKAVEAATKPLIDRIEKMENTRKSNAVEQTYSTQEEVKKSEVPSYVDAAFPME
ncbi:DNA methyltransferase [Carnobacterium divergens]|uniref:XkdF-like putative serine protease domain-containing protein n=1 Tax=Carnobacterium divergens TaxID=2748 RepID=UPI001072EA04|nr:XkdF-like putative serine protease domain-containing protein [Carnobacterium divergens]TFJ43935.1 DNA methyltransferase [Carnobacterium divergens]TFJ51170.1 DNA methyltransferase [Carnobacterium divergens]